jgi:cell wall-associated NlpC family hydrolase
MLKKEKLTAAAAVLTAMIVATGAVGVRAQKLSAKAASEAANHTTVLEDALTEARIEILDMDKKKQEFDKRAEAAIAALPTPTPTPEPTPTQAPKQVASSGATKSSRGTTAKTSSRSSTSVSLAKGSGNYLGSGSAGTVVELALQYNGAAYVWGGESPDGFDCSGFVKYIYATAAGISLPHSASAQARYGVAVTKDELQPGDLVFFETYTSGISHVGIYIGNNQFIHAANSRSGVRITALGSGGYEKYKGAVRLLR